MSSFGSRETSTGTRWTIWSSSLSHFVQVIRRTHCRFPIDPCHPAMKHNIFTIKIADKLTDWPIRTSVSCVSLKLALTTFDVPVRQPLTIVRGSLFRDLNTSLGNIAGNRTLNIRTLSANQASLVASAASTTCGWRLMVCSLLKLYSLYKPG